MLKRSITKTQPCSGKEVSGMHPSTQGPGKAEGRQLEMKLQKDAAAKKTVQFQRQKTQKHLSHSRMLQSPLSTDVINP